MEDKKLDVVEVLQSGARNYSIELNTSRAIADFRDGQKPVNRRLIYTMEENHLDPNKPHRKSSKIIGDNMASYHSHGDSGQYGALVIMAQPFSMNARFVDGQGNFGSIEGHSAAAMRYTESRMSKYAKELTRNLNKNNVEMVDNFDNTKKEPKYLPATFPVALTNGQDGIGWSMASSIIPHNPLELLDACIYIAENGAIDTKQLVKLVKGPDLPTGCEVIVDKNELINEIETGRARYVMRSTIKTKAAKKEPKLVITNLPYGVKSDAKFINKLVDVLQEASAFNVVDIVNKTSEENVNIEIICKDGTSEEKLEQLKAHLYKKTKLETSFTTNNLMLKYGKPTYMGITEYLESFVHFRLTTLKREWKFDKDKLERRKEIIDGQLRLKEITDEIIQKAKESDSKAEFTQTLIDDYEFTERQAENIAGIQIYQLGKQNFNALTEELNDLVNKVDELTKLLTDKDIANQALITDLVETRGRLKELTRKSKIIDSTKVKEVADVKLEDLIDASKTKVIVKRDLRVFQMGRVAYNNQIEKYKEDDIVAALDAMTTDYVIAVTKTGRAVTRFIHELPSIALDGKVDTLNKEVPDLTADDEFIGALIVDKNGKGKRFLTLTEHGLVKSGNPIDLLPKVTTKRYIKVLGKIGTLKSEDDAYVGIYTFDDYEFDNLELHVELKDESKKSGKVTRKVPLSKFKDRTDKSGGAGTSGVNTKKGTLPFVKATFENI